VGEDVTEDVARAREPRWVLEMAAVRLAHRPTLLPVDELMGRLVDLERRLASGGSPGGAPPAAPQRPGGAPPAAPQRPPATHAAPAPGVAPASAAPPGRFSPPKIPDGPRAEAVAAPRASSSAAPALAAAPAGDSWIDRQRAKSAAAQPQPQSPPTAAAAPAAAASPMVDTSMAPAVIGEWRRVVAAVEGNLVPVLKGAVPLEVTATVVRLAIDERDSFFRKKLATPEAHEVVAEAASRVFGVRPRVELVQGTLVDGALSIARDEENARNAERLVREEGLRAHPLVRAVCEGLGGEVTRVRLEGDPT
jgi:hypothetical protein